MNALPWTIWISFAGAALALGAGRISAAAARATALVAAAGGLVLALVGAAGFVPGPQPVPLLDLPWIPEFGIRLLLEADGISLTLVVLTGIASTAGVLLSWNVERRTGEFFALYLTLIGGVYGVFLSADAFLFFVFYEIAIVPKYFLIAKWGSTRREYAAMKLVLYSFAGSALVLAGLLWAYATGGVNSFVLADLSAAAFTRFEQIGIFALVFLGFAILAGLFPFHTWAPTGHVAAPTAASMLLAGVVMKLGAYGCLRVAMPLFPEGFAYWQPLIGWLAVAGIVYAGFVALVQDDLKFVVGYSSISHMGFVLLGLAAANGPAISGAVLQMFSHGIIASLLFAIVGRLIYDRAHTRQLDALRKLDLRRRLPFAFTVFLVAGLASMGMPGFSGFPAELAVLIGAWKSNPLWAAFAASGILVAAAFTLRAVSFGEGLGTSNQRSESSHSPLTTHFSPITLPERAGIALLLASTVAVGLNPDLLLRWILPSLGSPYMQAIISGLR